MIIYKYKEVTVSSGAFVINGARTMNTSPTTREDR
jgi:hypothetical protein